MFASVWMVVLALSQGEIPRPNPDDLAAMASVIDTINELNRGPRKGESPEGHCVRVAAAIKEAKTFAAFHDDTLDLARETLLERYPKCRQARVDSANREKDPPNARPAPERRSLRDRFNATRDALEKATGAAERQRQQDTLRWAALALLRRLKPADGHYQDVVDGLALSVVPKDRASALQAIIGSLAPEDLKGDKGKAVANLVSTLAKDLPPDAVRQEGFDSLVSFAIKVAKENPAWLQDDNAGQLLETMLNSLRSVPPEKLREAQVRAVFDFTVQLLKRDPRWLEGDRATLLAELVPRMLERMDVAKVKHDDLEVMLAFTVKVMVGRPDWPAELRQLIADWDGILQIVNDTKNPATRAMILRTVTALQAREGDAWKPLAAEVAKTDPDPQAVASLLQALGIARVSEMRRAQAALEQQEIVQATVLRLRTLVGIRLPAGCQDAHRDGASVCAPVFAFVDSFRAGVVHGAPQGGDWGPQQEGEISEMLSRAECTLLPPDSGQSACQGLDARLAGTFASFIALEVGRSGDGNQGPLTARAGCVVVSAGRRADRVNQVGAVQFDGEGDAAVVEAERLAQQVLGRCPLSRPLNDLATELVAKANLDADVSALSALVFAGLPYERDARVPRPVAHGLSALDLVTLIVGAGGLMGGVYAHTTDAAPWDDRLLRVGVVSLGVNLAAKLIAAAYYAAHYQEGPR